MCTGTLPAVKNNITDFSHYSVYVGLGGRSNVSKELIVQNLCALAFSKL